MKDTTTSPNGQHSKLKTQGSVREKLRRVVPITAYLSVVDVSVEPFGSGGWFRGPCPNPDCDASAADGTFTIVPDPDRYSCDECKASGDVLDLCSMVELLPESSAIAPCRDVRRGHLARSARRARHSHERAR